MSFLWQSICSRCGAVKNYPNIPMPNEELMAAEGAAQKHAAELLQKESVWCRQADENPPNGAETTILLVEDEPFVRDVTCEVLRSAGYLVISAKNATEAARAYDSRCGAVDLLLSDVVLPGETGWALAGRLRRQNPRLKVLLVTGYEEEMRLREVECEECLAKPFSTEVLLLRVRELLNRPEVTTWYGEPVRHAAGIA
jgi:two-component system cell cycle sensor histidine kinase/response regulator CckA